MTTNYHTPWQNAVTQYNETDMNAPLSDLDTQITALSVYVVSLYFVGLPSNSQVIFADVFSTVEATFPQNLTGSKAISQVAATAQSVLTINRNGGSIGSITWSAAGSTGAFTFNTETSFVEDDVLTITAPASVDATLAGLSITLRGSRD